MRERRKDEVFEGIIQGTQIENGEDRERERETDRQTDRQTDREEREGQEV